MLNTKLTELKYLQQMINPKRQGANGTINPMQGVCQTKYIKIIIKITLKTASI